MSERKTRLIAQNKKAYHDYFLEDEFQAGIELFGTEVKSLRAGKCNLKDSYVEISKDRQAYISGMHISPYEHGNIFNKDPMRKRRLLLKKSEINRILNGIMRDGFTAVPVKIYFFGSYVKVDIALARGKKLYDKRETLAKKTQSRDIERALKDT
jgi:SsrA-binding protein